MHAQVCDDLGTDTVGAQLGRLGRYMLLLGLIRHMIRLNLFQQCPGLLGRAQDNDHAATLLFDPFQRLAQRPVLTLELDVDQVTQRVLQLYTHQRRLIRLDLALDQRKVHCPVNGIKIGVQLEIPVLGGQHGRGNMLNGLFVLDAVTDQVLDGADLQAVFPGVDLQVGTTRHAAVFLEDLDNHGSGFQPGEACQVTAGLGMTGARQYTTGLRHQRKDMPGLHDVRRLRIRRHCSQHGACAVLCGDTGGHALRRLDGQGEVG